MLGAACVCYLVRIQPFDLAACEWALQEGVRMEGGETDHAMQRASFLQDLVDGGLDRLFFGNVRLDGE